MNEVNTTALLERVKRLERQNKLIKLTGIAVVLVMAFVLLVGAKEKVPKEIVAEKFRVVDTEGRTRVHIYMAQGGPVLALVDERGKIRADLSVFQEGPRLGLCDKNGKRRVLLSAFRLSSALDFYDEDGNPRAELIVWPEGPKLRFLDKNEKEVFSAP